jgi:hypothetical protein
VTIEPAELFGPAMEGGSGGDPPTLQLLVDGAWREAASGET